jgi:hypothetical protein
MSDCCCYSCCDACYNKTYGCCCWGSPGDRANPPPPPWRRGEGRSDGQGQGDRHDPGAGDRP